MSLVVPRSFALYESEVPAQMFYLRESEVPAQMFYLRESEAPATNVLSVRKRSAITKRPVGTEIPPRSTRALKKSKI
ncbi:hypothetical protein [Lysinibacillus xylanilyticus]|uniref:hypothetical protein n=1 Tax=Lysinibacillus xylanilyticus TaxID=582475 RepID=UPI003D071E78